jgi:hypothetical protein
MSTQVSPFFTPTQISGCQLWLDGADRNSLVLSGSNVTQWRDKSGGGRNFIQQGSFALPVFVNNGISSQSAVSFTGNNTQNDVANQILTNATFSLNSSAAGYSIFAIALQNTTRPSYTQYNYMISAYGGGTGSGLLYGTEPNGFLLTANGTAGPSFGFNDLTANVPNTTMTTTRLTEIVVNGGVLTPYLNGTAMAAKVGTCVALTGISIGNAYAPGQTFTGQTWGGLIGEILIYNSVVSTTQRQQVEGYLAWKWGLQASLPASHPYKNSPIPPLLNPPTTLPVVLQNPTATFLPTQMSGCSLWLDAADASTIGLSGSNITTWADKSGNRRNATSQGTGAVYSNNGLLFTGSQTLLGSNATYLHNSANGTWTVFGVFQASTTSIGNPRILNYQGTPNGVAQFLYIETGRFNSYIWSSPPVQLTGSTVALNTSYLTSVVNTTTNTILYVNGTSNAAVSHGTNTTVSNSTYWIGGYDSGADRFYGTLNELLVFSNNLSASQREQVEGYLAWKWGTQANLPTNHPYKAGPPYSATIITPSRSLGIPATWQPTLLSGCSLWLDAADRNSLVFSGTTVSQWNDKSGNSYNATQTVSGSRPSYPGNYITFSNNSYFDFPQAAINNTTTYALFLVFFPISSVNWILQKQYNGVGSYNMLSMTNFWQNNTGVTNYLYWGPHANTGVLNSGAALSLNTLQIIEVLFDGTRLTFYRNGTLLNTVTSGATLTIVNQVSATNCTIGSWRPDGSIQNSGVTNFQMNELNYYNVALSDAQRQTVEGYLAWKWGLQANLPATHPFKRWPPSP